MMLSETNSLSASLTFYGFANKINSILCNFIKDKLRNSNADTSVSVRHDKLTYFNRV